MPNTAAVFLLILAKQYSLFALTPLKLSILRVSLSKTTATARMEEVTK